MNIYQGPAMPQATCMFSPFSEPEAGWGISYVTFLFQVRKGQLTWASPPDQGVVGRELG